MRPSHTPQLVTITVAALLFCATATAHPNYVGFRGGVNSSTLALDGPADVSSVTRPMGGIVGVFGLTDWMAFQCELLWSGKGVEGTIPFRFFENSAVTGTADLNYLELPLLLRFIPTFDDRWHPYFYGGPGVAANLSAEVEGTYANGQPLPSTVNDGIDDVVTDGDLTLIAGAGLGAEVKNMWFEIDARYTSGLLAVDDFRRTANPRNRTWTFSLAMMFSVGD